MSTQTLQRATREQIFARVAELLAEAFDLSPEQVRLDSHLIDDLDLDSIDAVDLVIKLQEMTGKRIKPEEFKSVRTIGDVVVAVDRLLAN